MTQHPDKVEQVRDGNTKLLGFFVGQVLKASGGRANPSVVNTLVNTYLGA
jgi:glutaminyl-tRNA synthetase